MHPIERLRFVARATDDGPTLLVREAAGALASFADDPAALVTACRRLVDRQADAGALWWLASRVLGAADPEDEAWLAAGELDADATVDVLRHTIPNDASVLIVGWPEAVAQAIARRGDLTVFVVDSNDEGSGLVRRLQRHGHEPLLVPTQGIGAAVAHVDVVLLEAHALGSTGLVAATGSHSAAAVALHLGIPVWAAVGVGRVLPQRVWDAYLARFDREEEPWERTAEFVPLGLLGFACTQQGLVPAVEAPLAADCPVCVELLKPL